MSTSLSRYMATRPPRSVPRVRLPIISPATAMMLTNTVKTMNTVSTRSYVVVAFSSVAARDKPELIPSTNRLNTMAVSTKMMSVRLLSPSSLTM